jgi:hypothetical protein
VLWTDAEGPCELQFLRRLADQEVATNYIIGMRRGADRSTQLSTALGRLGIRAIVAAYNITRAPGYVDRLLARGFEVVRQEGEWVHIRRPIAERTR